MRTIIKVHNAIYRPIADLVTYSPLPVADLEQIDPFLFLNHHGPQHYRANNKGLPFGPHPHRGMETVTFILAGDVLHQDSTGNENVIRAGGVQWMTAGKGLIHAEVSSETFKQQGGPLEILQLWLNLPSHLKMAEPSYYGLQKENIPVLSLSDGIAEASLISGSWEGHTGAFKSVTGIHLSILRLKAGAKLTLQVPVEDNILFYVINGQLNVNETGVQERQLVEFKNDHSDFLLLAHTESMILFGHAAPLNEPVVAQGPFVMNTEEEIYEAYENYRQGKFGSWFQR